METESEFGLNVGRPGSSSSNADFRTRMKMSASDPGSGLTKRLPTPSGSGIWKKMSKSDGSVTWAMTTTEPSQSGIWRTMSESSGSGSGSGGWETRDENCNWLDNSGGLLEDTGTGREENSQSKILGTLMEDFESESDEVVEVTFPLLGYEGVAKLYQDPPAARRVFDNLVKMLRPGDIKRARRVSRMWFHLITGSKEFWHRFKILQIRNEGVNDWWELLSSDLVSQFDASEFHFIQSDMTIVDANLFLVRKSPIIKHLSLERCTLSPSTLQLIFSEFVHLESLNLNGLSRCIIFCESLFPSSRKSNRLQKLKSIKLSSNFGQTWTKDPLHWNVSSCNLHRNFLAQVLTSSSALETLTVSGWGSRTCSHVIEILLSHPRAFLHLNQLHFLNIPQRGLNFEHFHLLSSQFASGLIDLRKFSLTLFSPLSLDQAQIHSNFANIVIRNILKAHRGSLQVLTLDRCPVCTEIFTTEIPHLTALYLKSTQVTNANFGHLVPALTVFKHSRHHINFQPNWEPIPTLFTEDGNLANAWGEENGNLVVVGRENELTLDDLRGRGRNVRRGEINMWVPVVINILLLLVLVYIYAVNTLPKYEHLIYSLIGILVLLTFMAVKGYL